MNDTSTDGSLGNTESPVAFLIFAITYYFTKAAFLVSVEGVGMASVEGVAQAASSRTSVWAISPVFVYVLACVAHLCAKRKQLATIPIRRAITNTFVFHLCWFAGCVSIFVINGQPMVEFRDAPIGMAIARVGDWLSIVLVAVFFVAWYCHRACTVRVPNP